MDPLNVVGRSHDLALCSRVENYRPALLDDALYRKRTLFEWGGNLRIRPIEELPYLLPLMRVADYKGRRKHFFRTHAALVARVLKTVEAQGPIGGRDLEGGAGVDSYRARKDTGLALYYLWHRGDLMIHSRRRGERLYDLTSRLVPQRWLTPMTLEEASERMATGTLRSLGLADRTGITRVLNSAYVKPPRGESRRAWVRKREKSGAIAPVEIEGWRGPFWIDAEGRRMLDALSGGNLPRGWGPLSTTTKEEATFLAPLDIVVTAGRARRLFGFDYRWEVYVPAPKRRWGYYTVPILYGDTLCGRADLRYDRGDRTLRVLVLWLEAEYSGTNRGLAEAVGRGLTRLLEMTGGERLDLTGIPLRRFRTICMSTANPSQ